jgi:hypothetical protein
MLLLPPDLECEERDLTVIITSHIKEDTGKDILDKFCKFNDIDAKSLCKISAAVDIEDDHISIETFFCIDY